MKVQVILILILGMLLSSCSQRDSNSNDAVDATAEVEEVVKPKSDPGSSTDPESFQEEDHETFTKLLAKRKDLGTPESLIKLYYNFPEDQLETSTITVDSVELDSNQFLITLTHDGLLDDSMEGIKVVMTASINDGIWTVTEVKRNWRCREGRGPTGWGVESCQ